MNFQFPLTLPLHVQWMYHKFLVVTKTAVSSFTVFAFCSPVTPIILYTAEPERERCSVVLSWCEFLYWVLYIISSSPAEMYIFIVFNKMSFCFGDIVDSALI